MKDKNWIEIKEWLQRKKERKTDEWKIWKMKEIKQQKNEGKRKNWRNKLL